MTAQETRMTAHTPDDAVPGTFDPDSTAVDRPRIEAAVRELSLIHI